MAHRTARLNMFGRQLLVTRIDNKPTVLVPKQTESTDSEKEPA